MPIFRCHLLLLSTYFKNYLSTAWNQHLIHSFRIFYIAISNIHQPYISLSVSCNTKEHQYTFRTASYSRSHSHTAICYIAISNIQQPYISLSVSCDTKEHQYTFRTASYSRTHSHTPVTDWHQTNWQFILTVCSVRTWNYRKIQRMTAYIQMRIYKNQLTFCLTWWLTIRQIRQCLTNGINEWIADPLSECLTD